MQVLAASEESIARSAEALAAGLLVAFPTETVYGLGANAEDPAALQRLYAAKGRPSEHPVIVHIASSSQLSDWAVNISKAAEMLASKLWPGPLTLILPKSDRVPLTVTGGQTTVGIRVPSHPVALSLLRKFGGGIAAPSANKFGRLSPTCAEDVASGFSDDQVAFVLDGGLCDVGIESTIVDCTGEHPRILRPGMILAEQIQAIIAPAGFRLWHPGDSQQSAGAGRVTPRVPGALPSHYAPSTPVELVHPAQLVTHASEMAGQGKRVSILSLQAVSPVSPPVLCWIVAAKSPEVYARQLYRSLRKLDREAGDVILVESVPELDAWSGIADRLKRAAAPPSPADPDSSAQSLSAT